MNSNDPLPPTFVSRLSNWMDRQRAPKKFAIAMLMLHSFPVSLLADRSPFAIYMAALLIVIVIPCEKRS